MENTVACSDRMQAYYRIACDGHEVVARAQALAIEQSIEMPLGGVRSERVLLHVVASVDNIEAAGPGQFHITLSLALETTGFEIGQLLNILFGNSSLHDDVYLLDFDLPTKAAALFGGPRFGITGLRKRLHVPLHPLSCSALKPQGSSIAELVDLAKKLARGGIDLIKDDHGIANQKTAPFAERVAAIQQAIDTINQETGGHCCYAPNLTGGAFALQAQLQCAQEAGVGALMYAPMLGGIATLQELSRAELPLLAHPALAGIHRMAAPMLLGKLFRLAGADAVIFPNFGGRFSFTPACCQQIATTLRQPWHALASSFPVAAGGIQAQQITSLIEFYGNEIMLLIGGALLETPDITAAAQAFVDSLNAASTP